ncbi:hypothetical protein JCM19236_6378 [Vibrio sp. JCM 19236]|nr:hypothetical protein JCM19236_6378 [Vibrio sp. JCM 19236]
MTNQLDRLIGPKVPWQFRLMILLVFALVAGGIFLDHQAARVSVPDFASVAEERIDPNTGQTIKSMKEFSSEDRKMFAEIAKEKSANLSASAKLLYDFAKITLGALLASITNVIPKSRDSEPVATPPRDDD